MKIQKKKKKKTDEERVGWRGIHVIVIHAVTDRFATGCKELNPIRHQSLENLGTLRLEWTRLLDEALDKGDRGVQLMQHLTEIVAFFLHGDRQSEQNVDNSERYESKAQVGNHEI